MLLNFHRECIFARLTGGAQTQVRKTDVVEITIKKHDERYSVKLNIVRILNPFSKKQTVFFLRTLLKNSTMKKIMYFLGMFSNRINQHFIGIRPDDLLC